ncbi:MAG: hypothetical protein RM338_08215 [Nostoc sp. DedQUE12a]|nr:hypothetical protein [Nostoc sp. DedQUE12a]
MARFILQLILHCFTGKLRSQLYLLTHIPDFIVRDRIRRSHSQLD